MSRPNLVVHAAGVALLQVSAFAADPPAALEREVLADAAARVSFQGAGPTAGHNGQRFQLASAGGDMTLWVGGLTKFRYVINDRDTTDPDEDLTTGFEFNRTKLYVGGTVHRDTEFFLRLGFSPTTGAAGLEWARMTHHFDNGLSLTWGQYFNPFLKEVLTSEKMMLGVERSSMHAVFSELFVQGVMLTYTDEQFRLFGSVSDGRRTPNTSYYSPAEADFALAARAELRLGEASFPSFLEATSFRGAQTGGLLGVAAAYQSAGDTGNTDTFSGAPAADMDQLAYTADFSYKGGGWNGMAAFVGRSIDAGADLHDFGAMLQAGVFVTDQWEVYGRWDAVFPDDDRPSGEEFHTLTLGANHYFFPRSHVAKFTAEVAWFLDDQAGASSLVSAPMPLTSVLPSAGDDQWALRFKMQMVF